MDYGFRPFWLDFTNADTGETVTLDVADAPTTGNGETIVIEWDDRGFVSMPRVEPPTSPPN